MQLVTPANELEHHLKDLQAKHCGDYLGEVLTLFQNHHAQATLLYALAQSYPRPLSLWELIPNGLPEYGIEKNTIHMALAALKALRLLRTRQTCYLFLTRSGEALIPKTIAHFHSVH